MTDKGPRVQAECIIAAAADGPCACLVLVHLLHSDSNSGEMQRVVRPCEPRNTASIALLCRNLPTWFCRLPRGRKKSELRPTGQQSSDSRSDGRTQRAARGQTRGDALHTRTSSDVKSLAYRSRFTHARRQSLKTIGDRHHFGSH